uniref:Uncharacterized protein n=1 Tax=Magallana gigas TaxID=29159 RepID=A0A8W8NV72_MAGGI
MGRSSRSSMIMAHWHGNGGQIIKYEDMELFPRPGQIKNIILHNVLIDDKSCVHILAQQAPCLDFLASFASCYQRKNEIMSCQMLPESNEGMVGVSILIVDRVFGETVDLRSFELSKIIITIF